MKKINLLTEDISIKKKTVLELITSSKLFGITVQGKIEFPPYKRKDIFMYQRTQIQSVENIQELLGNNYSINEQDENILIKAEKAWKDICNLNKNNCDFYDFDAQGVNEFRDKELEDMSWMIIDFDVTYKEMLDFFEKNTSITLVYIQDKELSKFSSMGYFDDLEVAKKIFFDFCHNAIKDKLLNDPDYTYEYLDEDQIEAVAYFKAR